MIRFSKGMGNLTSQRVNSPASGLGDFSYPVNEYLISFFKQKSIFVPKNLPPAGLLVVIHDSVPFTPNSIVFPPLTALQILYSAPGELWNWTHPKPQDFPMTQDFPTTCTMRARDGVVIPTNPDEITNSEEYTCVISTKDGYPKMTHFYGTTVIDCHPIPSFMAATLIGSNKYRPMYRGESSSDPLVEEFLNHCYICRKNKQLNDTSTDMDGGLCSQKCDNSGSEKKIEIKSHKP